MNSTFSYRIFKFSNILENRVPKRSENEPRTSPNHAHSHPESFKPLIFFENVGPLEAEGRLVFLLNFLLEAEGQHDPSPPA